MKSCGYTPWQAFASNMGGIAASKNNNIYVGNEHSGGIYLYKFDDNGNYITEIVKSFGTGDNQMARFNYFAFDSSNNIFVSDTGLGINYIKKLDNSGNFIWKIGNAGSGSGDGQLASNAGIARDSSGNIYVSDSDNRRVSKFNSSGSFLTKWGSQGTGDGQFGGASSGGPVGIAVDQDGNVYTADTYGYRIEKFDSNGNFLTKWGSSGSGVGQFNGASYIAVDNNGAVYVSDTGNKRIQTFGSSGIFIPTPKIPRSLPPQGGNAIILLGVRTWQKGLKLSRFMDS